MPNIPTYARETDRAYFESYDKEKEPNVRMQNKLIAIIGRHDIDLLRETQVELEPNERENFLEKIRNNKVSREEVTIVLNSISSPLRGKTTQEIFADISDYPNLNMVKGLVKIALDNTYVDTGEVRTENIRGYEQVNAGSLMQLIERYPDPMSLDLQLREFMTYIEDTAGTDLKESYQSAKRLLLGQMYGRKYDYWAQMRLLAREALKDADPAEEAAENENLEYITAQGSYKKALEDNKIPEGEKRKYDEANNKIIVPHLQEIVKNHMVPYVIEDGRNMYVYSIPEKPDIADDEARKIYFELAEQILEHKPFIQIPMTDIARLKKELARLLQPQTYKDYPDLHTEDGFQTKNAIFRVFLKNNPNLKS